MVKPPECNDCMNNIIVGSCDPDCPVYRDLQSELEYENQRDMELELEYDNL